MPRRVVAALQALVAFALLVSLYGQVVLIPTVATDEVAAFPPYAPLQVPLVTAAIAFVVSIQAGLVAVLFLLHRAGRGSLFEASALVWTNVLIIALGAGLAVTTALLAYVSATDIPSPTDGMEVIGLWVGSAAAALAMLGLLLLSVLGRQLQVKAIALRLELDDVI